MRPGSELMRKMLASDFELTFSADLMYGSSRVAEGLEVVSPSLSADSSGQVEMSGRLSVVWSDLAGVDVAPFDPSDMFSPFGFRVVLFVVVRAGSVEARQQVADLTITEVPSVDGEPFVWGETPIYSGQRVDLVVKDRMVEVQRDRFTKLEQPASLSSVWAEIARLTGFAVSRTLPDAAVTKSVVYEESRVDAVQQLAALLGGVAFMEWDGTLSARPLIPGGPVAELVLGSDGTIVQVGSSLSADGVYNGVVVRGEGEGQSQILAESWIISGPLRATPDGAERTPFHRVPYFYSSPFITTSAQAEAYAPALLGRVSAPRSATLEVTCVTNPLLQVGDVVSVRDSRFVWTVRLTRVPLEQSALMTVTGDVLSRVPVVPVRTSGFGEGGFGGPPGWGE